MPKPNLSEPGNLTMDALVTFLLGSIDPTLPPEYMYKPADRRRCHSGRLVDRHQIQLHRLPPDRNRPAVHSAWICPCIRPRTKQNLPPVLTSEGARVNPDWLKRFLANPSLSTTDTNRNGVRTYLQVRMPTFSLSDDEIRKLVLFFEAMSSQPEPYIPPKEPAITDTERAMARDLFTSPAAPCLKCHATGNAEHDKNAIAPNFLLAKERLQAPWTERWVTDPAKIIPGTAMPSGLFKHEGDHWVFTGPVPAALAALHRRPGRSSGPLHVHANAAGASRVAGPHAVKRQIIGQRRQLRVSRNRASALGSRALRPQSRSDLFSTRAPSRDTISITSQAH